jgi:hypothetical protein
MTAKSEAVHIGVLVSTLMTSDAEGRSIYTKTEALEILRMKM